MKTETRKVSTPTVTPAPTPTPISKAVPVPSGGVSIINSSLESAGFWAGNAADGGDVASRSVVDVTHSAFSQATRIAVTDPTGKLWNGQLSFPTIADVSVNDVLLIHFYFRSVTNTYESVASFVTAFIEDKDCNKYVSR